MPIRSEPGYVRLKDKIPYHGKGIDELVGALRRVLTDNKYTQKIVLEVGVPHIYIEKLVPESEAQGEVVKLSLYDVIRNRKLEEYVAEKDISPAHQLWEIFDIVQKEGFEVCNIVAGNKQKFQKWLGVRIPQTDMRVFGTPFEVNGDIPDDVFIVCGAPIRDAEPDDVAFCVKGTV